MTPRSAAPASNVYSKLARIYDAIYSFKNYQAEADLIHALISEHRKSSGRALLDVACGTGGHLSFLADRYAIEGLDLSEEMLAVARQRKPAIVFHRRDMRSFDLERKFDAIICLFSAIGYMKTTVHLRETVLNLRRHLAPGGVLIIEPWITKEAWKPGSIQSMFVDRPELKMARMHLAQTRDDVTIITFHYLVGTREGIEFFTERHELGLFTHDEYRDAFLAAGMDVIHDPHGLIGRGLYIGIAPAQDSASVGGRRTDGN